MRASSTPPSSTGTPSAPQSHDRRPPGSTVGLGSRGRALRRVRGARAIRGPIRLVSPMRRCGSCRTRTSASRRSSLTSSGGCSRGNRPVEPGVWPKLFRRLQEGLPRDRAIGARRGQRSRLRRAEPGQADRARGVRRARLPLSPLPGRHRRAPSPPTSTRVRRQSRANRVSHRRAARRGPLFAAEHGNVVAALSEPSPYVRSRALVPRSIATALRCCSVSTPRSISRKRASRSTPAPSYVPKRRPAADGQGGRVEGFRQGRGEGQLGSMVLSEFLNPPLVLVDRLLNSGYLVHERRPRRAKLRDTSSSA